MIRIQENYDGNDVVIRILNRDGSDSSCYVVPSIFDDLTWDVARLYTTNPEVLEYLEKRQEIELDKPF